MHYFSSIDKAWSSCSSPVVVSSSSCRPKEPEQPPRKTTVMVVSPPRQPALSALSWCRRYVRKALARKNIVLEVTVFFAFVMLVSLLFSINRKLAMLR